MEAVAAMNVADVVARALERMAFVVVAPSAVTVGEVLARGSVHAGIELRGTTSLRLQISATDGLVREIAAGMLGCDESEVDLDEHGGATVAELANVIGGELVMGLTASDESMTIGLPRELGDEEAGDWSDRASREGLVVVLGNGGGVLLVTLQSVLA
jgi:CheY-specific phosphatase CheX